MTTSSLDLYSPKLGLDLLGRPGEKVFLKISVKTGSRDAVFFTSYTIGTRHAQISSISLSGLGSEVQVLSVVRYTLGDALREINAKLAQEESSIRFDLAMTEGKVRLRLESRQVPAIVKRAYTVGGRFYVLLVLLGKTIRLEFSGDSLRLYDSSRRDLASLAVVGNRLVLKRRFQNP